MAYGPSEGRVTTFPLEKVRGNGRADMLSPGLAQHLTSLPPPSHPGRYVLIMIGTRGSERSVTWPRPNSSLELCWAYHKNQPAQEQRVEEQGAGVPTELLGSRFLCFCSSVWVIGVD